MLLGDDYWIWVFKVDSADCGHAGMSRNRLCVLFLHKFEGVLLHDPISMYEQITCKLKRHVATRPSDYLAASQVDIDHAAMRLAAKRGIDFIPAPRQIQLQLLFVCLFVCLFAF